MVQRISLAALALTLWLLPTSLAHAQIRYGAGRLGYPGAYGYGYGYGYPIGVGSHIPNIAGSPYLYGYNLFNTYGYRPAWNYGYYNYPIFTNSYYVPSIPSYSPGFGYALSPSYNPGSTYYLDLYDPRASDAEFYQPSPTVPQPLADSTVLFKVRVPESAEVWINAEATTQTGADREYLSEGLSPRKEYTYSIKARWMENGKMVERKRDITVRGGEERVVNLVTPG
jgi:uncharacterized protein (TIGR03000 family)